MRADATGRRGDVTRFIVHIGPHKTGTTYIQQTLAALSDALLTRGISVASVWDAAPGVPSHMKLVWAIRDRNLDLLRDQLDRILAQRPACVVISCEALSRLDLEQIVQLRRLLGSAPTQLVYYLRRWPERLPSLWQEEVKFGETATLAEFLVRQMAAFDTSELRDTAMIDRFAAIFGATRIKLVSYSQLTDQRLDIARHFLETFLGVSDSALETGGRPNRSLPALETEVIRTLNVVHAWNGGVRSPAIRNWFLPRMHDLVPEALLEAMRDSLGTIRLDESAGPFVRAYQDLLTRYASAIVLPKHAGPLHELQAIEAPFVRQDYLLRPAVTNILQDIYSHYLRTL